MPDRPAWLLRSILLVALSGVTSPLSARADCVPPFEVRVEQVTASDPARPGRQIGVRIAHPARAGQPVDGCAFPVFSFGHGFTMPATAYQYLEEALATRGYVVALAETETGFSPSHADFAADLAVIPRWLRQHQTWSMRVGPYAAVGGHSMGGGAAMLAAASSPRPVAMVGLAPANTTPSAITAAATVHQPVLLLTGSFDCVTPTAQHAGPMFAALATDPAQRDLLDFQQGTHCRFSNGWFTCSIGESLCPTASLPASAQRDWTIAQVDAFLDLWLRQDPVFQGHFDF